LPLLHAFTLQFYAYCITTSCSGGIYMPCHYSGCATLLTTTHTVGLHCGASSLSPGCGNNPGWSRSQPPSPKWPKNVSSGTINHTTHTVQWWQWQ